MRGFLLLAVLLACSCTSNFATRSWDVVYVQGTREKDRFIADLEEKNFKYVIEKGSQDLFEIRFKNK